jgi:hypothetical protein
VTAALRCCCDSGLPVRFTSGVSQVSVATERQHAAQQLGAVQEELSRAQVAQVAAEALVAQLLAQGEEKDAELERQRQHIAELTRRRVAEEAVPPERHAGGGGGGAGGRAAAWGGAPLRQTVAKPPAGAVLQVDGARTAEVNGYYKTNGTREHC